MVLVLKENRMIVPIFEVEGYGIQVVVVVCQMLDIHMGVVIRNNGEQLLQVFNANEESKIINQRVVLIAVLMSPGTTMKWDQGMVDEMPMEVHGVSIEEWEGKYPGLFEKGGQYG